MGGKQLEAYRENLASVQFSGTCAVAPCAEPVAIDTAKPVNPARMV